MEKELCTRCKSNYQYQNGLCATCTSEDRKANCTCDNGFITITRPGPNGEPEEIQVHCECQEDVLED